MPENRDTDIEIYILADYIDWLQNEADDRELSEALGYPVTDKVRDDDLAWRLLKVCAGLPKRKLQKRLEEFRKSGR